MRTTGLSGTLYHGTRATFDFFSPLSHFGTLRAAQERLIHQKSFAKNDLDVETLSSEVFIIPAQLRMSHPYTMIDLGNDEFFSANKIANTLDSPANMLDRAVQPPSIEERTYILTSFEEGDATPLSDFATTHDMIERPIIDFVCTQPYEMTYDAVIDELNMESLYQNKTQNTEEAQLKNQRFIRLLEKNGFDGVVYRNNMEDVGSNSYVTLRAEQVIRLDKPVSTYAHYPVNEEKLDQIFCHFMAQPPRLMTSQEKKDRVVLFEAVHQKIKD